MKSLQPLDWPGIIIFTLALSLVIDAILEIRHSPARATAAFAAGVVLGALFAVRQRHQKQPMLDPAIFASRPMTGVTALLLAVSAGYWAVLAYLPPFPCHGLRLDGERCRTGAAGGDVPHGPHPTSRRPLCVPARVEAVVRIGADVDSGRWMRPRLGGGGSAPGYLGPWREPSSGWF